MMLVDSPDADCAVCLIQHDDEIHAATLSIRQWFRREVTMSFCAQSENQVAEEAELAAATVRVA